MLLNITENFKAPKNLRYPQKGVVVDNNDPKKLGRVKCVVAGLIEGRLGDLPWFYPWQGGGSASSASGEVPEIGSILIIEFKFDDIYSGFYTGAWKSLETASGIYNEDYPNTSGERDEFNNSSFRNKEKGIQEFTHSSGTTTRFDSAGNLIITPKGKIEFHSNNGRSKFSFDPATGKITMNGDDVIIEGPKHSINSKSLEVTSSAITENSSGGKSSAISGSVTESVGGSAIKSVLGNDSEVITGTTDKLYTQAYSAIYGLGKTETVVAGGIDTQLLAGGLDVKVLLGNISYLLTAGSYSVNIIAGNLSLSTALGQFKCGNLLGSVEVDLTGGVTIKAVSMVSIQSVGPISLQSSANVDIIAPIVTINKAAGGMVLTTLTSPVVDTLSGLPSIGVPTVIIG